MAVLLVEIHGIKRGSMLPRRVLIGRRSMNHLVIDDPGVSRMHAWIDAEGDRFYIQDAGSRTGTGVNGQRIVARHLLGDEDEITIGPAKLTFLAESRLRAGVDPIDLASPPKVAAAENGIPFDCPFCKAPLWASPNFAGGAGKCKYCGNEVVVPKPRPGKAKPPVRTTPPKPAAPAASRALPPQPGNASRRAGHPAIERQNSTKVTRVAAKPTHNEPALPAAPPAAANVLADKIAVIAAKPSVKPPPAPAPVRAPPAPPAKPAPSLRRNSDGEQMCGVCQSAISVFEEQSSCPCCGLVFHADCWVENYGCSAYGCPQVNALAPRREHDHAVLAGTHGTGAEWEGGNTTTDLAAVGDGKTDKPARFPWEFLLLAGSVFSALVGALTFGLPSLALAGGTVTYMARTRGAGNAHRGIILLSAGLALLGVIAGIPVSWFLYFGGPHS